VAQLCTLHSPAELFIGVPLEADRPEREWLKKLPHTQATTPPASHGVMLVDGDPAVERIEGATIIALGSRPPWPLPASDLVLEVDEQGGLTVWTRDQRTTGLIADRLDAPRAEELAGRLAGLLTSTRPAAAPTTALPTIAAPTTALPTIAPPTTALPVVVPAPAAVPVVPDPVAGAGPAAAAPAPGPIEPPGLLRLLGIDGPERIDVDGLWSPRPEPDRLRLPIGTGPGGTPVELDLKQAAQDGMGPHGMLVGAAGSGKTPLLRSLILGLALTTSPEALTFLMIDPRGAGSFSVFGPLPHTSAVISTIEGDQWQVDRLEAVLHGEVVRRMELLRKAGHASQREYERAREPGAAPLPSLLIVVDGFGELLTANPKIGGTFVQIGRVGRSLGIHLLLASQRVDERQMRDLDRNISYRIALRTFSAAESLAVLGVPDACDLPRAGHGLLRAGSGPLMPFAAAAISGDAATISGGAPTTSEDIAAAVVDRLRGHGTTAHQIWLPLLTDPPTLDELLPRIVRDAERGYGVADPARAEPLHVAVGVVDRPDRHRRDPYLLDLSGSAGHVAVAVAPGSGKTGLLGTLITSLALVHTPREVRFYLVDLGGGSLRAFGELPHVGEVADDSAPELVRRIVLETSALLATRERQFAAAGIAGIAACRAAGPPVPGETYADVFLVIDGWGRIGREFGDLEPVLADLVHRGLGYGIHVVASAVRWPEIEPAQRDAFGSRIELRLGDPAESEIDAREMREVAAERPGHGLVPGGLRFYAALARLDHRSEAVTLTEATEELVKEIRAAWPGPPAPPVRMMPSVVTPSLLPAAEPHRIPAGLAEVDLSPVVFDFTDQPHLRIFGEPASGKSSLLRAIARGVTRANTPNEAIVAVIDLRGSLRGVVAEEHLIGHADTADEATSMIGDIAGALAERLSGEWRGPELYLLVDDLDLVTAGTGDAFAELTDLLAAPHGVGLHLVVARRTEGLDRAFLGEPLTSLRKLSTATIRLSEEPPDRSRPPGRARYLAGHAEEQRIQLVWEPLVVG
jgi:S-DNA-T family DNA segregation ATPase FtsK/SpoIIIE